MTRCRLRRLFSAAMLLAVPVALCACEPVAAQTQPRRTTNASSASQPATRQAVVAPALAAKLTAPYQVAVSSKPLRELLYQIAGAADFNLWIDRNVDPDQLVSLPGGQKTVFMSLVQASQAGGADVVAVGNIVLVGQRQRIEQLAGTLLALQRQSLQQPPATENKAVGNVEIRWPQATTPAEAMRIVSGQSIEGFPHDHWPEVTWRDISPQAATLLVTSQFDLMPLVEGADAGDAGPRKTLGQTRGERPPVLPIGRDGPELAAVQLVRLASPPILTLRYPGGPHAEAIRSAAIAQDPRAVLSQAGDRNTAAGSIELAGSPAAHVAAISAMLAQAAPGGQATVDIDKVKFTLNLPGATAQNVLVQLAAAAGRKLQVSEQATTIVQRRISFNVQDQSLRQLVKTVTDMIGANAQWSDDLLTITPSP